MVAASSGFLVNGARVSGSATLFDGSTVATDAAPSRLQLSNGSKFEMSPNTRAKVYQDRIVLEQGYGDFRAAPGTRIEARGLQVAPADANSTARVAVFGKNSVQVATSHGAFRVYSAAGILMANVSANRALNFEPQAGSSASAVTGCLLKKDNKFVVFDETSQALYELRGTGFDPEWGNRVEVMGTALASGGGATQVLQVSNLRRVSAGGCLTVASQQGAQLPGQAAPGGPPANAPVPPTPPASAGGGGLSAGAKIGIAVAVIGGGAGAGIALALGGHNRS